MMKNHPGKGWKHGRICCQLQRGSKAQQEPQLCSATTQGGAKCRQSPPSPAGSICRGTLPPQGAEASSRAWGRGQITGFITGNTDDSLGGAILRASQKQEITHRGAGARSPWAWLWWRGSRRELMGTGSSPCAPL